MPEIKQHDIQDNDIFAIWASDGVWEFISSKEAIDIVWKHRNDLNAAVNELCTESTKRWKQEEEVIDDITAYVILLCFSFFLLLCYMLACVLGTCVPMLVDACWLFRCYFLYPP